MLCCAPECDRPIHYREKGLCQKHYFRIWRNGSLDLKKPPTYRIENEKGYQQLYDPAHPLANKNGYVFEHRAVLHAALGGVVSACELCGKGLTWATCAVDHINCDVRDNTRGNLRPTCVPCNAERGRRPAIFRSDTHAVTFGGETKTPAEWGRDPRVSVTGNTIVLRKKAGATDEDALFGPKRTHNGKPKVDRRPRLTNFKHERKNAVRIEIDGVVATAAEWSRHPACTVTFGGIVNRLKSGWAPEDAVFKPRRAIKATYSAKARELKKCFTNAA